MSKNFEDEYRRMIDREIPDLWDRIEAQLPDQAPAPQSQQTLSAAQDASQSAQTGTGTPDPSMSAPSQTDRKTAQVKKFFLRRNSALILSAAAVLCLLFFLPGMLRKESSSNFSNGAPASENSAPRPASDPMADAAEEEHLSAAVSGNQAEPADKGPAPAVNEEYYEEAEGVPSDYQPANACDLPDSVNSEQTAPVSNADFYIIDKIETVRGEIWYLAETLSDDSCQILFRFPGKEETESDPEFFPVQSLEPGQTCHLWFYPSGEDLSSLVPEISYSDLPACTIFKIQLEPADN